MKPGKFLFLNIAFSLLVASFLLFVYPKGFLDRIQLTGIDFLFRLRSVPPKQSDKIIIVEITDADIAKIGRWPWPRVWLATITQALSDMGAKAIFFDFLLSEPSDEEDDSLFEAVLKKTRNVYLPFVFERSTTNFHSAFMPLERFSQYVKGTGSINIYPDDDGIIRRTQIIFSDKKTTYPSAALKIAMDYQGLQIKGFNERDLMLENQKEKLKIPLAGNDSILLNWAGKWKNTFRHYSFLDVLKAYQDLKKNRNQEIDTGVFKESICLVAMTSIGLYDIKAVPVEAEYPGIGITATAINNILNNSSLNLMPSRVNILLIFILCLLPGVLVRGTKPLRELLLVLTITSVYFYIVLLLFNYGYVVNYLTPIIGMFITSAIVGTFHFFRISRERQQLFKLSVTDNLTGLYNIRYFKVMLETEIMLAEANPKNKFCLIMADIDHFKKYNDTYGHQAGDIVIREVALTIRSAIRSSDVIGRYGGEEMIILLRGADLQVGLLLAEKIRKNIASLNLKMDNTVTCQVTASFGVVSYKRGYDMEKLIKSADEGLYKAKLAGRNQVYSLEE